MRAEAAAVGKFKLTIYWLHVVGDTGMILIEDHAEDRNLEPVAIGC